jgi:dihydroorotase
VKILLKNGRVIDPSRKVDRREDVCIDDGKIVDPSAIDAREKKQYRVIDVEGRIISPGLIDMHVHFREPGREDEETLYSGARAALMGGFTSVACMPNTEPALDNRGAIRFIDNTSRANELARIYPVGAISKGRRGTEMTELQDMVHAGAVAFSDDGDPVVDSHLMRRVLEYSRMVDVPVISHCEDRYLSEGGAMNEGSTSTMLGIKGVPREAEEIMVARDIILSRLTGGALHIAHISTAESVDLVRRAKAEGVPVTAETAPHYFSLTDEACTSFDTNTKMNPPLRTGRDVEAVIEGLKDGTIDAIASDHAPHSPEEKEQEFQHAPFGIIGLETALGLTLTNLVERRRITMMDALAKITSNPAKILHLEGGTLMPGAPANVTVIDLQTEWMVEERDFRSKCRNTPFIGTPLRGRAWMTVVLGSILMFDGSVKGDRNFEEALSVLEPE